MRSKIIAINIVAAVLMAGFCSHCSSSGGDDANLTSLELSDGTLSPVFDKDTLSYSAKVPISVSSVTVKPTAEKGEDALITVNDLPATSGKDSAPVLIYPGANTVTVLVKSPDRNTERTYTVTVNSVLNDLESILQGNDTDTDDQFGWSIACDGTTLVVGAPYAQAGSGQGPGAVYVFTKGSSGWIQAQKLTASDGANNDLFGWSIALSGDTIAVGAPYKDHDGTDVDSGAVYIFTKIGGTWAQRTEIESNTICKDYYFGWSVSLQGITLSIGEPDSPASGVACSHIGGGYHGNVQIFTGIGPSWTYGTTLTAAGDDAPNNYFGEAISLDSGTLAVGTKGFGSFGAVYIFTGTGASWTVQKRINAASPSPNGRFGSSLSLSASKLLIGSETESTGKTNSGAVYLFSGSDNSWTQAGDVIKSSSPQTNDYFGHSVSIYGDVFAIGVPGLPNPTFQRGYVPVFAKQKFYIWGQVSDPLIPSGTEASLARFGQSVVVTGTEVMVGADNYDLDGSGAVYVYH